MFSIKELRIEFEKMKQLGYSPSPIVEYLEYSYLVLTDLEEEEKEAVVRYLNFELERMQRQIQKVKENPPVRYLESLFLAFEGLRQPDYAAFVEKFKGECTTSYAILTEWTEKQFLSAYSRWRESLTEQESEDVIKLTLEYLFNLDDCSIL